jgi:PAS domain S-box-containing protein
LTENYLGWFTPGDTKFNQFPNTSISSPELEKNISMCPDYMGGIYLSSFYQLRYYNYLTDQWQLIDISNGLLADGSTNVFIDYEKNIWVSNDRGVSKIASKRFSNFQMSHGMLEDEVTAVIEYKPGLFVLGHNKGVTFWDGQHFTPFSFMGRLGDRDASCRVIDIAIDSKNNIWMALSGAGLGKITPQKKFRWYGHHLNLPMFISSIWINNNDKIWLCSDQGLFIIQPGTNEQKITREKMYPAHFTRKIFGSNNDIKYAATYKDGVWVKDDNTQTWAQYLNHGNPKANSIYAVIDGPGDDLLVGSLNGLYKVDSQAGSYKKIEINGKSIDNPVYVIAKDRRNHYWIGTDNGVLCWNPGNEKDSLQRYSISEGLIGQETNRSACISDSRGRIWIGTNRGVSIYNHQFDDILSWNPAPRLHLKNAQTNLDHISLHGDLTPAQIKLSANTYNLVFHFRGLSFRDENAIRFAYKMEGLDKKWVENQHIPDQSIRYANLAPGSYRFYIKARNGTSEWSQTKSSPLIVILKPFYKSWWFYTLIVMAFIALLYIIFQFIHQQRYASHMESQIQERTHQLNAVEQRYRALFEESKDCVFVTTPGGKLLDINPAGLELFGFSSLEDFGANNSVLSVYNSGIERESFRAEIEKKGYVKDFEITFKSKEGDPFITQVTATVVKDNQGNTIAYRGFIRDITDKKRLEMQLVQAQKMEAIGTLAGGIAHDFNNILGVITGYSELVLDDLETGSLVEQNARHILTASQRASELVKQILAFSRQSKSERKPVVVSQVVIEALKLLRSSLPSTIEIRRYITAPQATIMADATQIHQVMMNLCANSAHAMKKKGGILEVHVSEIFLNQKDVKSLHHIKPGHYVRLTVSDTGHGIPKVVMKRIFDPYFTTKSAGEGTGMGLAMIHGIVKSHGGDITVTSEIDKGASFHVYLPRITEPVSPEKHLDSKDTQSSGGEHILLIDDEISLADVTIQMLTRMGYQVMGKSSPIDAVDTFKQNPDAFDLVLTDLTMPGMTGLQVAREIKKIKPQIPVILCSGFSANAPEEEINEVVDDFLMKPVVKSQLSKIVRKLLDTGSKKRE